MSAFFEINRQEYYSNLLNITQNSDWNSWLIYFLNGITQQAKHSLQCASQINELLIDWRKQLPVASNYGASTKLLEYLTINPSSGCN